MLANQIEAIKPPVSAAEEPKPCEWIRKTKDKKMIGTPKMMNKRETIEIGRPCSIQGTVKKILYTSGMWGLLILQRPNGVEIKAKGDILPLSTQTEVELEGKWENDPRRPGELIFQTEVVHRQEIATRSGLIKKLAELPDVGKKRAESIVNSFGEDGTDLLSILEHKPELVAEKVRGITLERAKKISIEIKVGWGADFTRDVQLLAVLPKWIVKKVLLRWPGPPHTEQEALKVLHLDPYRLIELAGVGFKRADKAAMDVGTKLNDPRRHVAALQYILEQATKSNGHTWISFDDCLRWSRSEQIKGIDREEFHKAAATGIEQGYLVADPESPDWLSPKPLAIAEEMIANCALSLAQTIDVKTVCLTEKYELNELQERAVHLAQTRRLLILTGGPGTGKTYTLKAILEAMSAQFSNSNHRGVGDILLCAPTGKAARRMTEMTGLPAFTVHRLLGYKSELNAWEHGQSNPLSCSLVVCDEASMLDTKLAGQLFASIPSNGHLILVGDVDQLPSVGPGKVLHDLIESNQVPVVRLQQVMRQAEGSAIVSNAHALIQNMPLSLDNAHNKDFRFFEIPVSEDKKEERVATANMIDWAHRTLRNRLGYDVEAIQVLSPQHAGEVGVSSLNQMLRSMINPEHDDKPEITVPSKHISTPEQRRTIRVGDRVIQVKNDYDLDVMNGQIGTVRSIREPDAYSRTKQTFISIAFDGGPFVELIPFQLQNVRHAYCITVHKSQGSEWPVIIVPVSTSHSMSLTRRLLYTAITRGKEMVVLVGTRKALHSARRNIKDARRITKLLHLLRGES